MFGGCDDGVLSLFVGVRGVGIARVTGCADEGLALWLEQRMMRGPGVAGENGEEYCRCEEMFCGKCGKKIEGGGMEWFRRDERDVWTLGNR